MTHKTRGLVLRTVKYGETSLVVTMLTQLFGIQTYMVNGVRTTKRAGAKASLYQPGALLQLEVYHNDRNNMQRIKEAEWSFLYANVYDSVIKNCVQLYMMELLYKLVKQPEENADLFYFAEDSLQQLDAATEVEVANFPLFFTVHLPEFFGFKITNASPAMEAASVLYLDLQDGNFTNELPQQAHYLAGDDAHIIAELLKIQQVPELKQLQLNRAKRRELLAQLMIYYQVHVPDFSQMKTLQVINDLLS